MSLLGIFKGPDNAENLRLYFHEIFSQLNPLQGATITFENVEYTFHM